MKNISLSLSGLLGKNYIRTLCSASSFLQNRDLEEFLRIADTPVDFVPDWFSAKQDELVSLVGSQVIIPAEGFGNGAPTKGFEKASSLDSSPISGLGCFRVGEDGRLYLASKSEHYHASLGHNFPGFKLLENALKLGIVNAAHNNSRGYITRKLERELIKHANGLTSEHEIDEASVSSDPKVLNRVLNLSTGSLAAEAGIKMMLKKFYQEQGKTDKAVSSGKTPVFFVIGDYEGGRQANYHGTTFLDQLFRDMWPEIYSKMVQAGILRIVPVRINDAEDFQAKLFKYSNERYAPAGFIHEIVLMNYGVILLEKSYLQEVYALCREKGIPILCDEIQSGIWYPEVFAFRRYGLKPDIVVLGKGFSAGHYAASRVISSSSLDLLSQFGALVTNGQQELASLAFLITLEFVKQNGAFIEDTAFHYQNSLKKLAEDFPELLDGIDGLGHMSALRFNTIASAEAFAKELNKKCIDISVHTYKPSCPPSALTKLPLVATRKIIEWLVREMEKVLSSLHNF